MAFDRADLYPHQGSPGSCEGSAARNSTEIGARLSAKARAAGRAELVKRAKARAADLMPMIGEIRQSGITSLRGIATALNERGFKIVCGCIRRCNVIIGACTDFGSANGDHSCAQFNSCQSNTIGSGFCRVSFVCPSASFPFVRGLPSSAMQRFSKRGQLRVPKMGVYLWFVTQQAVVPATFIGH
jgi:hypothetical protein